MKQPTHLSFTRKETRTMSHTLPSCALSIILTSTFMYTFLLPPPLSCILPCILPSRTGAALYSMYTSQLLFSMHSTQCKDVGFSPEKNKKENIPKSVRERAIFVGTGWDRASQQTQSECNPVLLPYLNVPSSGL
jgi:hypothetical protein